MIVFSFYLKTKRLITTVNLNLNLKLLCIICVIVFSICVFVLTVCMALYFILFVGVRSSNFRLLISFIEQFSESL